MSKLAFGLWIFTTLCVGVSFYINVQNEAKLKELYKEVIETANSCTAGK